MQIILETQKTPEQLAEICQMIGICPVGAMKCPFKDKMPCEKIQSCRGVTAETWEAFFNEQDKKPEANI